MTTKEISKKSTLTESRANYLMGYLAIKKEDSFWIKKIMDFADKGFTNRMIIDDFFKNNYWIIYTIKQMISHYTNKQTGERKVFGSMIVNVLK